MDLVASSTLSRARGGDEQAFRELTEPYRRELHVHCYRILGSFEDAEDAVQESLVAAWRGLSGFRADATPRAWLYRIATNQCLNMIRARSRRPPTAPVPPFDPPEPSRYGDVTWLQPYPSALFAQAAGEPGPETRYEAAESIELAFIAALQRIPPRQAAALVLGDVVGFPVAEVAGLLGATPTSVKGLLQRARAAVAERRADRQPVPSAAVRRSITRRFARAFAADDIDGVVAVLTDDAWLSMPPAPHEYRGTRAIASFLQASANWRAGRRFRLRPADANGQPGFACYLEQSGGPEAIATGIIVLGLAGERVDRVTRFLDPHLLRFFGLPAMSDDSRPANGS
jgi:RNA polymerase sigma-70 factor (TIGR02960 family)